MKPMQQDNNAVMIKQNVNSLTTDFEEQQTEIVPMQNSNTMLSGFEKAQIDIQISTAKRFPRELQSVMVKAESAVSLSPEIAESCFYTLKRRDKTGKEVLIEGPSVRLAEIIASAWGNLRVQVFLTDMGKYIRAIANVIDLENNYAYSSETIRRGTDRFGKQYNEDLLIMNANAAMAIAKRNAILNVVPRALITQLMIKAQKIAAGSSLSLKEKRERWLLWFENQGIKKEQVLSWLEIKSEEEINIDHIKKLAGLKTALEDGETTIEEEFGKNKPENKEQIKVESKPEIKEEVKIEKPTEIKEEVKAEEKTAEPKEEKVMSIYDELLKAYEEHGISAEQILKFSASYGYNVDKIEKLPITHVKKMIKNVSFYVGIINKQ